MTFRSATTCLLLTLLAIPAIAATGNNFLIVSNVSGKTVGRASYNIDKTKTGYKIQGRFEYHVSQSLLTKTSDDEPASGGGGKRGAALSTSMREGQFTTEYKLDADGNFITGYTQNVAAQVLTSYQPNKPRTEVTITQTQAGSIGNGRDIPLPKPNFLFTPDFDPAPIQMLITTALTHPHPDSFYTLFNPDGVGIKPGEETFLVGLQLAPGTRTGTLDGKPVTLRHLLMNYHSGRADLFIDESGNLMEAQMGTLQIDYVRANFVLAP